MISCNAIIPLFKTTLFFFSSLMTFVEIFEGFSLPFSGSVLTPLSLARTKQKSFLVCSLGGFYSPISTLGMSQLPAWGASVMNPRGLSFDLFIYKVLTNFIDLFIDCAASSLLCGLFSSCSEQGLLYNCSAQASCCSSFSCWWARVGSVSFGFRALEHVIDSCGVRV